MTLAEEYIQGLKNAYLREGCEKEWRDLAGKAQGASAEEIAKLRELYPDIPHSLVEILQIVDGTFWREYPAGQVCRFFLGSDLEKYPYYLLSAREMAENDGEFAKWADYIITREYDDVPVDEGVCDDLENMRFLHLSDCMNNGGTSQLFIDFSPSAAGKKGQVVRYLHDPDEMAVIADSFDDYLIMLIKADYDFISGEIIKDW